VKKKTFWGPILQVIGLLFGIGSLLCAVSTPQDRVQFGIQSIIGFAILIWGTILVYRGKPERE
jgi:hypothetical protein